MEYSQVSADEDHHDHQEDVTEKLRSSAVAYHYYLYPCYFLEQALRAFFKCLGVETKAVQEDPNSSGADQEDETVFNHKTPSTPEVVVASADPSVTATDPEADPPSLATETSDEVAGSTRVLTRAAVRPPISRGGGGQIN